MLMIAAVMTILFVGAMIVKNIVRRSRRRRWRAERKERHARIVREWSFLQNAFGPKPKRLSFDPAEPDGTPD